MESRKAQILRIVNNIYNINKHNLIHITFSDNTEETYKYKNICGNNLFEVVSNKPMYEIGCDTLDDLRERILKDFMYGSINNIRIK